MPTDEEPTGDDLEVVSDVAQQRRQEARPVLERQVPEMVLSVDRSEVSYKIQPKMLPLPQVDFKTLRDHFTQAYRISFKLPDLGPLEALTKGTTLNFSEEQVGEVLLRAERPDIEFSNGRFPLSKNDFVPIISISFDSESIIVAVQGIGKVADLIAAEVAEAIWASTGAHKRWEEIKPFTQMISYGTATKVNLGFPLERLLHVRFREFITDQMIGGQAYGSRMGAYSARHDFQKTPNTVTMWTLDDLTLKFFRFDQQTGRSEDSQLRFTVTSRDEQGTGIVAVISKLPFDVHVECLQALVEALKQID